MTFYLGTHHPNWLGILDVPLFVSRRRLAGRKSFPVASVGWALDSGGFTELNLFGRWETEPARYADDAARFRDEIGRMDWAATQDWMCEPHVLAKTGKTVAEHQSLSIKSYLDLRDLAPDIPWIPVLQGWEIDDYLDHVQQYRRAGVELASLPVVGVGSVCRRQATSGVAELFRDLKEEGISCHGFGLKVGGLIHSASSLVSADSMAWSFRARRSPPLLGCTHKSCANCSRYAIRWRDLVLRSIARPRQSYLTWSAR